MRGGETAFKPRYIVRFTLRVGGVGIYVRCHPTAAALVDLVTLALLLVAHPWRQVRHQQRIISVVSEWSVIARVAERKSPEACQI